MGLSLDALLVLDAIDRRGSFAAAAIELDRVPSAISYTVRRLEEDLDALLFDRAGRRAQWTPAGRELLLQGRALLARSSELEQRIHRISTGWEAQLRIAIDGVVPMKVLWPLCASFDRECGAGQSTPTRLHLSREILGGAWDALAENRVDLVIGASGEAPSGGGWRMRPLAAVPMAFVVAPGHPLASAGEPLSEAVIAPHRVVVAADSSRRLAPRTVGMLLGQDALTVADLQDKLAAQIAGLGCGWLPWFMVADHVAAGRLVHKRLEIERSDAALHAVWRQARPGKALAWWIEALRRQDWRFLSAAPAPPERGERKSTPGARRRSTRASRNR